MTSSQILDQLTNALGNPNFDLDAVQKSLNEKIKDMEAKGENTGSLLALTNVLPEVVVELKKKY